MKYEHLTQEQRHQIYAYSKANLTQKETAREMGVHKSTVFLEIKNGAKQLKIKKNRFLSKKNVKKRALK